MSYEGTIVFHEVCIGFDCHRRATWLVTDVRTMECDSDDVGHDDFKVCDECMEQIEDSEAMEGWAAPMGCVAIYGESEDIIGKGVDES